MHNFYNITKDLKNNKIALNEARLLKNKLDEYINNGVKNCIIEVKHAEYDSLGADLLESLTELDSIDELNNYNNDEYVVIVVNQTEHSEIFINAYDILNFNSDINKQLNKHKDKSWDNSLKVLALNKKFLNDYGYIVDDMALILNLYQNYVNGSIFNIYLKDDEDTYIYNTAYGWDEVKDVLDSIEEEFNGNVGQFSDYKKLVIDDMFSVKELNK